MKLPKTIEIARTYIGTTQYSTQHQHLVNIYNEVLPRPRGYQVTLEDDWCDIFVTAIADLAGVSSFIGRECGVEHHLQQMRQLGIWQGRVFPKVGDMIVFDYNGGYADHIGYVETVEADGMIGTIEGNSNRTVARQRYHYLAPFIVGYARPKIPSSHEATNAASQSNWHMIQIAKQVIRGDFGNGEERKRRLHIAGYSYEVVQAKVNEILQENKSKSR